MLTKLEQIKAEALNDIEQCDTISALDAVKVKFLGKKGRLTEILRSMGSCAPEDRPKIGMHVNNVRAIIEEKINNKNQQISQSM